MLTRYFMLGPNKFQSKILGSSFNNLVEAYKIIALTERMFTVALQNKTPWSHCVESLCYTL